jgi:single-strand DNA-binding protein
MSRSLNRVQLIGHLGRDPEIRSTNAGKKVATFSIATGEQWTDKATGEKRERTDWHNVVVFNEGLAGVVEKYVKKGSRCMVEGELRTRKWQDQSGNDRYSTEVVLPQYGGNLILLDGSSGRASPDEGSYGTQRQAPPAGAATGGGASSYAADLDDDIPF